MSAQDTPRRRLSRALMRHVASVMPASQRHWADAMRNELSAMADDRAALRWAIGCIAAACIARMRGLYLLDVAAVRVVGVFLAGFRAFDVVFPTLLTTAYRLGALETTDRLGAMTPGDDYHRLIPLMEAIPTWIHALSIAGGMCYLAAIVFLLRRRRTAYIVLLVGVCIELALKMLGRLLVDHVGVAAVPDPSFLSAVILPFVLPLLLTLAAWSGSRRESLDQGLIR